MRARPICAALVLALGSGPARGEEQAGTTAAPVIQVPLGARAVGMGTAFTAVADDISTLHYNPAGLSSLAYRELSLSYLRGFDGQALEHAAIGTPLPFAGLIGAGYSTLAASALLSQNGRIEVNRTNADGSFRDSRTLNAGGDLVAGLGYAERVADTPIEYPNRVAHIHHFLGLSGKFIRSTLAEEFSATAFAGDLGYLVRSPELGWSAGLSVLNIGTRMKFVDVADPLPFTLRAGGAWRVEEARLHALTLAADGDYVTGERAWHVNTGAEFAVLGHAAVRVGYQFHRDVSGLTAGAGLSLAGVRVDYAWALADAFTDLHRFSFTYRFGKVHERQREKARRPFIESIPEKEMLRNIEDETPRTYDRPKTPRRPSGSKDGVPGWIY